MSKCIPYIAVLLLQVSVVPIAEYEKPEGQLLKPGSRKSRKKELYKPRGLTAQASATPVAA